jgi:hypothetical protein
MPTLSKGCRRTLIIAVASPVGLLVLLLIFGLFGSTEGTKQAAQPVEQASDEPLPWTEVPLTDVQMTEGRRALCDAVRDEWDDVQAGTQAKDKFPLILAVQSFSGDGGETVADAAVRKAFADYLGFKWKESDCPDGALPDGAIDTALVKITNWWYPDVKY